MTAFAEAPDMENRHGSAQHLPPGMEIMMTPGLVVALRGCELSVDTWNEGEPDAAASITIRCRNPQGRDMALFMEQSADDCRALAASLMRAARQIDTGRGVQ